MYQIVVNSLHIDDNGLGIRLVNIRMIADLNNNTAELKLYLVLKIKNIYIKYIVSIIRRLKSILIYMLKR